MVRTYGAWVILVALVVGIAYALAKKKMPKRAVSASWQGVSALGQSIVHPFVGFERMRRKKTLSLPLSFVCLAFFIFLNLFRIQFIGKQFSMRSIHDINLLWEMFGSAAVLVIWVISNWCFSVLIEGKATFREIWITSTYCLMPYTGASFIQVILSNFLIRQESFFATCIVVVGVIWSLVMLAATFTYFHEFEGGSIIRAFFLTLLGMAILAILIFVFYMLIQQLVSTVLVVCNEIMFGIRSGRG